MYLKCFSCVISKNVYFCNRFEIRYDKEMQLLWKVAMHYNFINQTYIHWICWSTEKEIIHTSTTTYPSFILRIYLSAVNKKEDNPSFVGKLGYLVNQEDNCVAFIHFMKILTVIIIFFYRDANLEIYRFIIIRFSWVNAFVVWNV